MGLVWGGRTELGNVITTEIFQSKEQEKSKCTCTLVSISFDCKRLDYTSVFQKVQPGFSAENLLRDFLFSCMLVYVSGRI